MTFIKVRATALILAIGINVLFLSLLLLNRRKDAPEPVTAAMIWITAAIEQSRPPQRRSSEPRLSRRQGRVTPAEKVTSVVSVPSASAPVPVPEDSTAIALPPTDWHAVVAGAARNFVRDEEVQRQKPSLDSKPKVLVLPDAKSEQERVEHFEGGVTMNIKGDCVTTRNPGAMQPWALDPVGKFFGNRPTGGGGCRPNPSRERAEALERAVKPRYLGGTRPPPQEPATSIKIP